MKHLAQEILESAKVHEKSWSGTKYKISIPEAVNKVCRPVTNDLVRMLLVSNWNEALDWALATADDQ